MTPADYKDAAMAIFKIADANSDSGVDFEEFKNFYPRVRTNTTFGNNTPDRNWRLMFNVYDRNKSGKVSWTEAWSRLRR